MHEGRYAVDSRTKGTRASRRSFVGQDCVEVFLRTTGYHEADYPIASGAQNSGWLRLLIVQYKAMSNGRVRGCSTLDVREEPPPRGVDGPGLQPAARGLACGVTSLQPCGSMHLQSSLSSIGCLEHLPSLRGLLRTLKLIMKLRHVLNQSVERSSIIQFN